MKKKIQTSRKRLLSVLLAVAMVLTALPLTALSALAATSGDFEYEVLSETDKTCQITDYTGSATDLTIPSKLDGYTVTSIGYEAFYDCTSLTSVTIPDSVTDIDWYAFSGCTALTSITIPDSVMRISSGTFEGCTALAKIQVGTGNLDYASESGVLFDKEQEELICYPAGKQDTSYTIPNSVKYIGDSAFKGCTSLASVTLQNGVTSIGNFAFYDCASLTSITIPNSVTSIGERAFYNTAYVNNESNWENGALYLDDCLLNVRSDSTVCNVKDGTRVIAARAAADLGLTTLSLPNSVRYIGEDAFYHNELTVVTIPEGVLKIEMSAFAFNYTLTEVTLPASLQTIDEFVFFGIPDGGWTETMKLKKITFLGVGTEINYRAFGYDNTCLSEAVIYGYTGSSAEIFANKNGIPFETLGDAPLTFAYHVLADNTARITKVYGAIGDISIPATINGYTVTSIGDSAFQGCSLITSITIPNSVTEIGNYAFSGCTSLASIEIPNNVTGIGVLAFSNCSSLTSIEMPNSATCIGPLAFANCSSLASIKIPDSVTIIDEGAFYGCASLTSITIPNSVTYIGSYVFEGCTALTSITIPDSVTYIGSSAISNTAYYNNENNWENDVLYIGNHLIEAKSTLNGAYTVKAGAKTIAVGAFSDCTALTSITFPNSVLEIDYYEFGSCTSLTEINVDTGNPNYASENGVLFDKEKTELLCYPAGKQDNSYVIPDGVTVISIGAFSGCTALTSITIPDSVQYLWESAFANCTSLTSVTIPNSVTFICYGVFNGCSSLASVTIPNSVKSIDWNAFTGCTSLTSITIPDSVTSIDNYAFYDSGLTTIYGYTGSYAETFASENGYTFIALQKLTDTATGVSVGEDSFENLPETTVLNVEKLSSEENTITYDITLTINGETAQPASAVTVKIPVPETMDGAQCKVYRQETDGTYTDMHAIYQNGYMVFTTDHFSTYVLTTEKLEEPTYTLGDVNGDDKINAVDARFVLQAASGARVLDDTQKAAADVNGDGKINAVDARWILQVASGVRTL